VDDLRNLLSLLLGINPADIVVEVEELTITGCCGTICK
jgi:hypothetical protein